VNAGVQSARDFIVCPRAIHSHSILRPSTVRAPCCGHPSCCGGSRGRFATPHAGTHTSVRGRQLSDNTIERPLYPLGTERTATRRTNGLKPWVILGLWSIPALLSTLETVAFTRLAKRPMPVYRAFLAEAPQWYSWALLTPLIFTLGERFPLRTRPRFRNVIIHAAVSVILSLLVAMADAAVNIQIRPSGVGLLASTGRWFLGGLPTTTFVYFAIILLSDAVESATRLRERETELRDVQLAALRMQLQPHFLFNSLNAIMALVRDQETAQAVRAVSLLSEVLRTTVNVGDAHSTTLRQELDFVRSYLEIERVRFGDRLRVTMDVPEDLLSTAVPIFVLQPFVENALKHGILRDRGGNEIAIRARNENGALLLTVRDDGRGLVNEVSVGVGIANAQARLERMYGRAASLNLRNGNPGVEVQIRLPRPR
jgi:two-component system LytT family sensor kinase